MRRAQGQRNELGWNAASGGGGAVRSIPTRPETAFHLAWVALALSVWLTSVRASEHALVLQTDFGLKDGAVAALRGVAVGVSPRIALHDLSHENTPFHIWEAAYRLKQVAPFWPAGTVFVSVVDPGVGTSRKAIALKTKSGHFFVGPDNGTWTLIAEDLGVDEAREIDDPKHRRAGSGKSYTFHGRDLFVIVGAKLAAGLIGFEDVGPKLPPDVVRLSYERPRIEADALLGTIPALDFQYGNVWTNLDERLFAKLQPQPGDLFRVTISREGRVVYRGELPYARTFGDVAEGAPLLYLNSLMNVAFALNRGDFAQQHQIGYGGDWSIRVEKIKP